jgi:hypothetical protein
MNAELLQLLAGVGGAFLGGLFMVWRASKRLPQLINSTVAVITSAVSDVLKDDVRQAVKEEVTPLAEKVATHDRQIVDLMAERQRRTGK